MIQKNTQSNEEELERRKQLKEIYFKEAQMRKLKHRMAARSKLRTHSSVIKETGEYSFSFLMIKTDDETLY